MKNSSIIVILVLTLFSCKKDSEENTNFPLEITLKSVEKNGNLSVYNNGQLITDQKVANQFVTTGGGKPISGEGAIFNLDKSFQVDPTSGDKIIFKSADSVYIYSNNTIVGKYSYRREGLYFIFSKKFNIRLGNLDEYNRQNNYLKFRPGAPTEIKIISGLGGDYYQATFEEIVVGSGSYENFNFHRFVYKTKTTYDTNNWQTNTGYPNNIFAENFIPKVLATDTLAIQQYLFKFKS